MITAKQIIKLSEQYFDTKKISNNEVVIYKNPTSSDIASMLKAAKSDDHPFYQIRFIADGKNKVIYAWDPYLATHDDMSKRININLTSPTVVIFGECYVRSNTLNIDDGQIDDVLYSLKQWTLEQKNPQSKKRVEDFFMCDWSFIHPYIPRLSDEIKRIKYDFYRQ